MKYSFDNKKIEDLRVGDIFEFGSYPQDLVEDSNIIAKIKDLCETPNQKKEIWNDFEYRTGKHYFTDIVLSGQCYRCVFSKKHRIDKILYEYSDYKDNQVYIFEFKPIRWKVLSVKEDCAMLVSEKLIDTYEYFYSSRKRKINKEIVYPNNYRYSIVREWLNTTFYNSAFTDKEKCLIKSNVVRNDASTTKKEANAYVCEDTVDKVFLLSYQEAKALFSENKSRWKKTTEYAKSQGCFAYKTRDAKYNNAVWWLRSPDSNYCDSVRCVGDGGGMGDGGFSIANESVISLEGIAPVIVIKYK